MHGFTKMFQELISPVISTVPWNIVFACSAAALAISLFRRTLPRETAAQKTSKPRLVAITGCDSGLGFSIANWAADAGYIVLAGCLSDTGEGAALLHAKGCASDQDHRKIYVQKLNLLDNTDIENFATKCHELIRSLNAEFYAWIPNAATLFAGENFWLTDEQMQLQFDVNFWGTVKSTRALEKIIMESKCKIIVVTSDCAEFPLPKLGVYAASKGALELWARSMRFDLQKYGVHLTCFRPGSFINASRLMYNSSSNFATMKEYLQQRGTFAMYKGHFEACATHYNTLFPSDQAPPVCVLQDFRIRQGFLHVLENDTKSVDIYEVQDLPTIIFKKFVCWLPKEWSDKMLLKVVEPYHQNQNE